MSADLDPAWTPAPSPTTGGYPLVGDHTPLPPAGNSTHSADGAELEEERPPAFSDPEEFFVEFFSKHIQRRLGGSLTWCPQWWIHPEGLSRIVSLWTAFEHLRWEGALGISTWWNHHVVPHLAVLMSKDDGPFSACKPDKHSDALPSLPHTAAPQGLWQAAGYAEPDPDPRGPHA